MIYIILSYIILYYVVISCIVIWHIVKLYNDIVVHYNMI